MTPRCLPLVLLLCVFVPAGGSFAASVLDEITVRIYDTGGLDDATRATALDLASATLAPAAHVRWRRCNAPVSGSTCDRRPAPGELVLRIVQSPGGASSHAARGQLRSADLLPLGEALVDHSTHSGVLATIYLDRVRMLARAAGVAAARLLGHAIAHEIGHLLLASNAHGVHGLMRAIWSSEEVRRSRPGDWIFSGQELAAIRARREAARIDANIVWGTR
jgi:hypothetical protein